MMIRLLGFVALLLTGGIFGVAAAANIAAKSIPSAPARTPCTVLKLYDGDTFACDLNHNGRVDPPGEKIRLIGIDAPEMAYSRKNHSGRHQPYAQAAMEYLAQYQGRSLYLVWDIRRTDPYGRTLAYAYLHPTGGTACNQRLLELGLARVVFLAPNVAQEGPYLQAAHQARLQNRGIWQRSTTRSSVSSPK